MQFVKTDKIFQFLIVITVIGGVMELFKISGGNEIIGFGLASIILYLLMRLRPRSETSILHRKMYILAMSVLIIGVLTLIAGGIWFVLAFS